MEDRSWKASQAVLLRVTHQTFEIITDGVKCALDYRWHIVLLVIVEF